MSDWKHVEADEAMPAQRTKFVHNWKRWRTTRTRAFGEYEFRGTAHRQGSDWWVNLRVVFPAQDGHRRVVSKPMYIDQNRFARCG